MKKKQAVFWLKLAFAIGVITDAAAVIPMLSTDVAKLMWGFEDFTDMYRFAMGIAAVFMTAWTLLLIWAYAKPLERKMVALLTLFVLVFFLVVEIIGVNNGIVAIDKALPTMSMQILWSILYSFAYLYSRHADGEGGK